MIHNFIKTAVRNFLRNGFYSGINIIGLSIGISCAILIFSIIRFELSYDEGQDRDHIYRVVTQEMSYGELTYDTGVPQPYADAFRSDYPQAKWVSIVDNSFRDPTYSAEGSQDRFFEDPVFVEADYFKIIKYNWLEGSPQNVFPDRYSVIITESVARKYFGDGPAYGKILIADDTAMLTVRGVVADPPLNFSFPFTVFMPHNLKYDVPSTNWSSTSSSTQCYMVLDHGVSKEDIEATLTDFYYKYNKKEPEAQTQFFLQSLRDIHFNTEMGFTFSRMVKLKSLYALGVIGLFIILTACINFINLNTVQVVKRAKEIGIRKVMGSGRAGLIFQFLSETALISVVSIFLSLGLVELSLIHIDKLLGYSLEFGSWLRPDTLIFLVILFVMITVISGWYPALVLSGFQPALALRKKLSTSSKSSLGLRRTLVIVQFAISQALIVGTIIVARQMNFFNSMDMGFNKDSVVEVRLYSNDRNALNQFKTRLLSQSFVTSVSFTNTSVSSSNIWNANLKYYKGDEEIKEEAQVKWVDSDFAKTYGLKLIEGEDLVPSDTCNRFLVNEEFLRLVGATSPDEVIGNFLYMWGEKAPITGVVKDFFSATMHEKISPVVIGIRNQYSRTGIKINSGDIQSALKSIEDIYKATFPKSIFLYDFLDQKIKEYYDNERRENILLSTFSFIAILISCLGLLGLVSYMAQQRVKEVGIRKVFGAPILHLLNLFTREFVVLILIGFLIAAPVSYFSMQRWLADFPYHVDISGWFFLLTIALSIFIAVVTVGYHSYRAATANPVDVLRDE